MDEIDYLLSQYAIGRTIKVDKIEAGNTSNTFKITTDEGVWILRSLKNELQGKIELKISEHIHKQVPAVVAKLVQTETGEPYARYGKHFYNLQEYMEGEKVTPKMNCLFQIGESIGMIHDSLETSNCKYNQTDRFDIETLWKQAKNKWQKLNDFCVDVVPNQNVMNATVNRFINHTTIQRHLIHGDLGIWNMLINRGTVKIIDFGEARLGHFYFDLAAGITTAINEDLSQVKIEKALPELLKGYEKHRPKVDLEELLMYIHLWYLRGSLAILAFSKVEEDFYEEVVYNFKMMNKYTKVFKAIEGN
ncbi:phosphotransferase [Oceanobacillus sojae]|uniref:phosphotransferase n=1 Tax=Oceanobacillus sojae TaxID=582851 RepID=UPI000988642F|nr:phosphotransferase [Oceanobacillus sojae]